MPITKTKRIVIGKTILGKISLWEVHGQLPSSWQEETGPRWHKKTEIHIHMGGNAMTLFHEYIDQSFNSILIAARCSNLGIGWSAVFNKWIKGFVIYTSSSIVKTKMVLKTTRLDIHASEDIFHEKVKATNKECRYTSSICWPISKHWAPH